MKNPIEYFRETIDNIKIIKSISLHISCFQFLRYSLLSIVAFVIIFAVRKQQYFIPYYRWSHFQVQGHIFGKVVTLYQLCGTKTLKISHSCRENGLFFAIV